MASRNPNRPPQRLMFAIVSGAVLIGALVAAIVFVDRANGLPVASTNTPAAAPTSAAPTPSPTPANIPFADCSAVTFGSNLQPVGVPADPHVYSAAPTMQIDTTKLYRVTITTQRGPIVLCLQPALAPITVNSFVALARNHFYDGLTFHRVVPGFVVQGGDPTNSGSGGPGYHIQDEPDRQRYVLGAVAMAKVPGVPNSAASDFFICIADDTNQLTAPYNLFGKVASGIDVAQRIVQGDVMQTVTVAQQQ